MAGIQEIDGARAEAFAGQMVGVFNGAALALMTSIGHQVGLFDKLAELPPATSAEIASAAGLNERYVREWLGAMVTGRIVEYDPAGRTYRLPPEHAMFLTRAAGSNNMAGPTQFIPLLAQVEPQIIECFRNGGGVPYSAYGRFQALMAEDSAAVHDGALVSSILPLVPGLVPRLEAGIDVLDAGCGSGHAINLMAEAFPSSRFAGFDFSEEGVARAREEARVKGLTNARFEVRDITTLNEGGRYDLITAFDAIHDQAHPAIVLRGISNALRPGGAFLMVDIAASSNLEENLDHPMAPAMYSMSCTHCMTVSLAQGGDGLGNMWGEQTARRMLAEAGFTSVDLKRIDGDMFNSYFVATKG